METRKHKTVPLGPKPTRTDETRRALASVTPAREVKAADLWAEHAPKGAEGMVKAEGKETDET
jgi:hypothetical protein